MSEKHDREPAAPATRSPDSIVRVRGLRVLTRGGNAILENVSLDLIPGEILGIVGESGSGKTTTARALLGYASPGTQIVSGEIEVDGHEISRDTDRRLRAVRGGVIAYVPQNPGGSLNPSMRLGAAVRSMLREHRQDVDQGARVAAAFAAAALPADSEFQRRYPHELSGGQQQRGCLAVALSCEPPIIVLDEPTTGLDVITQAHIIDELRDLRRQQLVAMVYVSHDLAVVARLADRVAVMYAGRIVETGPTSEVLADPRHPYTKGLIASIPDHRRPGKLASMPGIAVGVGERPPGCAFAPRCMLHIPQCDEAVPALDRVDATRRVRCIRTSDVHALELKLASVDTQVRVPDDRTTRPTVLAVSHLRAEYHRRHETVVAASDVSFELASGECVALVGESGSGKTTIARVIAGLHHIADGEIRLHGELVQGKAQKRTREQRQLIQLVFQNPTDAFNPRRTVGGAIARPARYLRGLSAQAAQAEVDRLLELVRLPRHISTRLPRQLSGGELQRAGIARALAASPDIMICDEITSSLDVSVQAAVLSLLSTLRAELNMSMLFITHDLGVVSNIADRVLVLDAGEVCEQGDVGSLISSPIHPYTKRLISAAPSISAALSS